MQRLKNIEDNLSGNDGDKCGNNNKKVGLFKIIKDIKNKGVKISDDNEGIKEIRHYIQELKNKGVKVCNYDEMTKEIKNHTQSLKDEGIRATIDDDQVNDFIHKILKGITLENSASTDFTLGDLDTEEFLKKCGNKPLKTYYTDKYGKHDISTDAIHNDFNDYVTKIITEDEFLERFNVIINKFDAFSEAQRKKKTGAMGSNQKKLLKYGDRLKKIVENMTFNPTEHSESSSGRGLKI